MDIPKKSRTFADENVMTMSTLTTYQADNEVLSQILKVSKKVVPENAKLILFGSRARGDARKDSDWDLLILLDKDRLHREDYNTVSFPLTQLGWEIGERINPVMYTNKEWEMSSITEFYEQVNMDGILLQ